MLRTEAATCTGRALEAGLECEHVMCGVYTFIVYRNRSSFGPNSTRGRLEFGRMLACRTRTARNRRVKDVRRSVAGALSAASARYLPIGDSDFGAVKPRFIKMAT